MAWISIRWLSSYAGCRSGFLYSSVGNYKNFHLRAEVRALDGGNSGFFLHAPNPPDAASKPRPYEASIRDVNAGYLVTTVDGIGRDIIEGRPVKPGEWFILEAIVKGNRITVVLNGIECGTHEDDLGRLSPNGGYIFIENAGGVVEFRRIEIMRLE